MKHKIEIKLTATPSLNKLHSNRWQMLNWKKKYLRELRGYEFILKKADCKRVLEIERHGSRMLDSDNAWGSLKPMIDALKEKEIIVDDSPKWCDIRFKQVKCKRGQEKTVVYIWE